MSRTADAGQAYLKAEPYITRLLNKHLRTRGGDPDELQSEAHMGFLDAWASYDPSRGASLTTWACTKIRHRLRDYRPQGPKQCSPLALERIPQPATKRDCPDDCALLILAALSDVPDVVITAATINSHTSPVSLRLAIIEYFRGLGWGVSRLADALELVREVI